MFLNKVVGGPVADPGLNFGRGMGGAKVQKVPKLTKHSV